MRIDEKEITLYYPKQKTAEVYPMAGQFGAMSSSPVPRLATLLRLFTFCRGRGQGSWGARRSGHSRISAHTDRCWDSRARGQRLRDDRRGSRLYPGFPDDRRGRGADGDSIFGRQVEYGNGRRTAAVDASGGVKTVRPLENLGPPGLGSRRNPSDQQCTGHPASDCSVGSAAAECGPDCDGAPSRFWLRVFFWCSVHARWLLWITRPICVWITVSVSTRLRDSISANARRIFRGDLPEAGHTAFARRVVGQFYDCVVDIARGGSMTAAQLRDHIESIEGREAYLAHRALAAERSSSRRTWIV